MLIPAGKASKMHDTPPLGVKKAGANQGRSCLLEFGPESAWIDFTIAAVAMASYVLWIYAFRYRGLLGEDDLYRMLVGLLDGARTSAQLASANQYGKAFSFGYIAVLYRFAGARTLADPERLMALINAIGFWSAAAGCLCLWLLARMLYGLRAATVAVMLFALSPTDAGAWNQRASDSAGVCAVGSGRMLPAAACTRSARSVACRSRRGLAAGGADGAGGGAAGFSVCGGGARGLSRLAAVSGVRGAAGDCSDAGDGAFFAMKAAWVDSTPGTGRLGPFLEQFIRLKEIPIGAVVIAFELRHGDGCRGRDGRGGDGARAEGHARRIGRENSAAAHCDRAAGVDGAGAGLLDCHPRPARHFILCLAGVSMLTGIMIERRFGARPLAVYAVALGIVAGNQALGAVTGPLILRYAPSKLLALPDGTRHLPRGFPTGTSWGFHRAFVAEELKTEAFAARVRGVCDDKTLVMSLDATQIFAGLYAASYKWSAEEVKLRRFPVWEARINGRAVRVLSESEDGPRMRRPMQWPIRPLADTNWRATRTIFPFTTVRRFRRSGRRRWGARGEVRR